MKKIVFYFIKIKILDSKVKNFSNLKELILSCNYIEECDFNYFPQSLKVIELDGNSIKHLSSIHKFKLNLEHLGLGENLLTNIDTYFESNNWLNLVSLDLSYNQITDMISTTKELFNLKVLKALQLYGNPIVVILILI